MTLVIFIFSVDAGSDSDVEILYEVVATPEQVARAEKYQLPKNFYLYETNPECPGCRGCVEDYDALHRDQGKLPPPSASLWAPDTTVWGPY